MGFLRNVANDDRIPGRDKKVLLVLIGLIASPVDIIPDWIPVIGALDDLIMIAIVMDYFFNQLDQELLLSHWPWGMKSYARTQRTACVIAQLTPGFIRDRVWKYKPSVYDR